VARQKQDGRFRVRQREQLRRTLQDAAEALEWDVVTAIVDDPIDELAQDVQRLTKAGIRAIEKDLEAEIQEKRQELKKIERTVTTLEGLSEKSESDFPTEVTYQYTSSQGNGIYSTKEEEVLVESPTEAAEAAARLEKRIARLTRLRDEMVEELKRHRGSVNEAKSQLVEFVTGTRHLVHEVVATLH
jgi:t-SNARE complex subunit (syntaxin)